MGTRISGVLSKCSKEYIFISFIIVFISVIHSYYFLAIIRLPSPHSVLSDHSCEDVFSTVAIPFLHYYTYNHTDTVTEEGVQCFFSCNMYLHKIFIFLFQTLFDNFTNVTIQVIYIFKCIYNLHNIL